jgi:hypothetical protein
MNNIKMDLKETGWGGMDWIDLSRDGHQCKVFIDTVMNLRGSIKCCTTDVFSRRAQLHAIS